MILGRIINSIDSNNIDIESIELSLNKIITNDTYGTINTETPDQENGIIQIGNELFLYKYYENFIFYNLQRGYKSSQIESHQLGDLIYKIERVNVKEYDSLNIYDVEITESGLLLDSMGDINIIRGVPAIIQDVRFTLQSIGNMILNNQSVESLDVISLTNLYIQNLSSNQLIQDIEITSISKNDHDVIVNASANINGTIYNNIEFILPSRSRL